MSTTFNPIQGQTNQVQMNQPLSLREGQVFHGTIKQLYPNQMAEVQVGNNKLVAKLETPLKAGDAHFFQVTSTGTQTELKVVTGPMGQTVPMNQQIQQLLQTMNLPKTTEMQQVMGRFLKEQLPISREQLLSAETWMKNLPEGVTKQAALSALSKMVELKMPFTQNVLHALTLGSKTDGMSTTIQQFMQQLAQTTTINDQMKTNLMQTLQTIAKPLDGEVGGTLLARATQTLLNPNELQTNKMQMLNLLKEASVLPKTATLSNWQQVTPQAQQPITNQMLAGQVVSQIVATKSEQVPQMVQNLQSWVQNAAQLSDTQKDEMLQLIQRFTQLPKTTQTTELFAKQFQEQLLKTFSNQQQVTMFTQDANGHTNKDHLLSLLQPGSQQQQLDSMLRNIVKVGQETNQPFVQAQVTQSDATVQSQVDSKAMEQAIKNMLRGLGVSYEAALANKAGDIQALAQSLKPQLLALIQDAQVAPALKDSAEMLMARLNGMQLLSGENGHQHQLVMQVPLDFLGKRMDATLQWNGRMRDDGKIDPNFARVLFYLNMESMRETVVDMQIQNRVVTINVFNDSPGIAMLAEPFKQGLKNALFDKEYHLSGVFVKPFEREVKPAVVPKQEDVPTNGVDYRI